MRKINTFWNWFQDNNQTIKNFINETPKSQKQISHWIKHRLGFYCKELDYMIIFPKKPTEKTELIITANGNPEYFDQVIQLINNAPVLRNWRFIAFIQLTEKIDKIIERLDDPYVIQELTIKTNEVKFLPLDYDINSKELDIIIYLKNYYIHCNTKTLQQIIYVILKDLLGEKSIYRKINFIQLAKIPNEIDELIKLYEFQYYIYEIN
ncbi:hypothetical protein [Flavobacterium sp.]|uniref:hypothetical protein n=1 Tax=Flavobacterium sp. TaxID=239 RepID=UPI00404751E8